jgi:hypothetical protein
VTQAVAAALAETPAVVVVADVEVVVESAKATAGALTPMVATSAIAAMDLTLNVFIRVLPSRTITTVSNRIVRVV